MTSQVYSSHQQTRQQLEELDALLQRMLTLPVNTSESAGPPAERMNPEAFAPLPPTLPNTHVLPRLATSEPIVQAWRMAPAPQAEPPMALSVDEPMPTPAPYPYSLVFGQPLPAEVPPLPMAEVISAPAVPAPAPPVAPAGWAIPRPVPAEPSYSLFALPFVAINRLFDVLLYLLGPIGTWLRGPTGRTLLGWLGVLMILGAIGWAAYDWYRVDWNR